MSSPFLNDFPRIREKKSAKKSAEFFFNPVKGKKDPKKRSAGPKPKKKKALKSAKSVKKRFFPKIEKKR